MCRAARETKSTRPAAAIRLPRAGRAVPFGPVPRRWRVSAAEGRRVRRACRIARRRPVFADDVRHARGVTGVVEPRSPFPLPGRCCGQADVVVRGLGPGWSWSWGRECGRRAVGVPVVSSALATMAGFVDGRPMFAVVPRCCRRVVGVPRGRLASRGRSPRSGSTRGWRFRCGVGVGEECTSSSTNGRFGRRGCAHVDGWSAARRMFAVVGGGHGPRRRGAPERSGAPPPSRWPTRVTRPRGRRIGG